MSHSEQRIDDLEVKLTFLESQHHELNEVVTLLQLENASLKKQLGALREQMEAVAPSLIAQVSEETPPPHY
ncbi:MAG: SlyX family protein [Pseudomonadota bacterium]